MRMRWTCCGAGLLDHRQREGRRSDAQLRRVAHSAVLRCQKSRLEQLPVLSWSNPELR